MCGFAGFLGGIASSEQMHNVLSSMGDVIAHRGPDDKGVWYDLTDAIGFSHRRLAIVDLSPAGHQPMNSVSGRYVIAFNGEIYNHAKLRAELESVGVNPNWRGHSDTETLLACFEYFGIEQTLKKAIGMFAIGLWDNQTKTLILARDRFGEKPLYYGQLGSSLVFGSELKSIRKHPSFQCPIDTNALTLYMRHNYIPSPYSIYQGIKKLEAGTYAEFRIGMEPLHHVYWSVQQVALSAQSNRFEGSASEAVDELESLLTDAISQQMMADVPLGAFLSGGIDSSTVVALMQANSARSVKTFSIGFREPQYNEAEHAKAVAAHLQTDHTELYVTPENCLSVVPKLATIYDEPFADSSQIPTLLVSQLAKTKVTVSLSGDAGDELFAGYNRYTMANGLWGKLSLVPKPIRHLAAQTISAVPINIWNSLYSPVAKVYPKRAVKNIGDKLHKGADVLACDSIEDLYRGLVSHWGNPEQIVIGGHEYQTVLTNPVTRSVLQNPIEQMMLLDQLSYMQDDILVKVDRASMAVSLESRVPFLDHRVAEFAWRLPLNYKLRAGQSKWVLRQVLYRHVPRELIDRPKMGFGVPLDKWLRNELRDWSESLLNYDLLQQQGLFDANAVRLMWQQHLSGKYNWQYHLWDILMFQAWLEEQ